MKYTVWQEREKCIGCGACASVCDKFWEMDSDGKSKLKGSKKKGENFELIIDEKDLSCNKEAAEKCPVNIIHIKDEKGKKLI
ncbi:MAG: ferredoxin [Candidatus Nanoarchaeia archaeon]|nr:ferredoxin [Candidatus Nanoarchaeia archaeon]